MPISFKLFCVGNHTISIDADNGIARRMKGMQMDSDFVEDLEVNDYENKRFILDRNFGNLLATKYKHAFAEIIFEYAYDFIKNGNIKPYPNDWKEETNDVCQDNNKFTVWFNDRFDVDDGYKISKVELDEVLMRYTDKNTIKIKDELKRMRIKFKYDGHFREDGKRGFYFGFQIKKEETIDLEEEEEELELKEL